MVRFRVADSISPREEFLVEAFVPSCGNDAALVTVFNSECAAQKFVDFMNTLSDVASFVDGPAIQVKLAEQGTS